MDARYNNKLDNDWLASQHKGAKGVEMRQNQQEGQQSFHQLRDDPQPRLLTKHPALWHRRHTWARLNAARRTLGELLFPGQNRPVYDDNVFKHITRSTRLIYRTVYI